MNIIVPMAITEDSIDANSEYQYPKPLIDLKGKPIIQYVIDNLLTIKNINKIYFIVRESICAKYHLDNTISLLSDKAEIVYLKNTTSGSVCSILMAIDKIPYNEECIIVNSDQIILTDLNKAIKDFIEKEADGGVITFNSVHPRWSYALTDENAVIQLAEKNPISKNAIAGFYYFKSFELFKNNAFKTLIDDDNLNGNYYISAVLNQLILESRRVVNYEIASTEYLSLYSNQKIKEFEEYLNKNQQVK